MRDGLRVLAVVPARGGSDSVPYLNIKRLGDKPLLAHTIDAARAAPSIDRVVVSTDDPRVAEAARAAGAEVPFLRPSSLARDMPSLKPVIVPCRRARSRRAASRSTWSWCCRPRRPSGTLRPSRRASIACWGARSTRSYR